MLFIIVVAVVILAIVMSSKSKSTKPSQRTESKPAVQPYSPPPTPRAKKEPQEIDSRWLAPASPENGLYPDDYLTKLKAQQEECTAKDEHYKFVVLNLETTGLDGDEDDILHIVIIDDEGRTLIDQRCKPTKVKTWDDAAEVNDIWYKDVAFCPTFEQIAEYVKDILSRSKKIVTYQRSYRQWFLDSHGVDHKEYKWTKDTAKQAVQYYNALRGRSRSSYLTLDYVADMVGYSGETETTLGRAQATRYIYLFLDEWTKRQRAEATELKIKIKMSAKVSTVDTKTPPPGGGEDYLERRLKDDTKIV